MEKKSRKRWLAGALAVVMCCSALLPAGTYAASAETEGIYLEAGIETQAETEAQKSEEELISEIEATPDLALTITAGETFDLKGEKSYNCNVIKTNDICPQGASENTVLKGS